MAIITVDALVSMVRSRGEHLAPFVSDSEIVELLNEAIRRFDGLVGMSAVSRHLRVGDIAVVAGTSVYSVPADCVQVASIGVEHGGVWYEFGELPPGEFERVSESYPTSSHPALTSFVRRGSTVVLGPVPGWTGTAKLTYVSEASAVASGDSIDVKHGAEGYIVSEALAALSVKSGDSPSAWIAMSDRALAAARLALSRERPVAVLSACSRPPDERIDYGDPRRITHRLS